MAARWDTPYPLLSTGVFASLLLVASVVCAHFVAGNARARHRLFSATLDELVPAWNV